MAELLMNDTTAMLNAFASIGTTSYTLTQTDIHRKPWQKTGSIRYAHSDFLAAVPALLATGMQSAPHNLIIRPHDGPGVQLIQLDDLKSDAIRLLSAFAFLVVETSPNNFQAWVALDSADTSSAGSVPIENLIQRLVHGVGADTGANGAVRLVGSYNVKPAHAPNFPLVRLHHVQPGLRIAAATLEISGLLASTKPPARTQQPSRRPFHHTRGRGWPDYQRCLDGAPVTRDGSGPDVSRADYTFCLIATRWGWSDTDIAAKLLTVSSKAKERGSQYAELTARNAAAKA